MFHGNTSVSGDQGAGETGAGPSDAIKAAGFIARAADANPARWQRGNKTQIKLSISPELLAQLDEVSRAEHLSRAALLTVFINDGLRARRSAA
jgi:hypothetical protein